MKMKTPLDLLKIEWGFVLFGYTFCSQYTQR